MNACEVGYEEDVVLLAAKDYLASGLSVVPIRTDGSKAPTMAWKRLQENCLSLEGLDYFFCGNNGVAIITGKISGYLEVLDFDKPGLFDEFSSLVNEQWPGLLERLPQCSTPSGGKHVYYRSPKADPNKKLAVDTNNEVLIETRGEGGYVLAPPSPASCHPAGRVYIHVAGPLLTDIPNITASERDILIGVCQSFNQKPKHIENGNSFESVNRPNGELRPGDDFNDRVSWEDVLPSCGWKMGRRAGNTTYWGRPGKVDVGISATTGYCGDYFYNFSTNSHPFEADTAYSKFAVYTLLNHQGDYRKSARELANQGFGKKSQVFGVTVDGDEVEHLTELGNAKRLVRLHGQNIRYCFPWRKWLVWNGIRWLLDDVGVVIQLAKDVVTKIYQEVSCQDGEDCRKEMARWAIKSEQEQKIRAMVSLAQSEPGIAITPDQFDRDRFQFNCLNGTLDLKTGNLNPHKREDLITKMSPVVFDPNAVCPKWDSFLLQIMGGKQDLVDYLQRVAGYSLTGDTREQVFFFLYGTGANGKSTYLLTLQLVMGKDYARQAEPELLIAKRGESHPTGIADLFGARLVATSEVEQGRKMAESLVKQITGGDQIKARRMREDFWEFSPTHKIFLSANHKLVIRGTDNGIWRRIRLVPFNVTIPLHEQDKNLLETLAQEASGILAWAVRGCLQWQQIGLNDPREVMMATDDYKQEMDVLSDFLEECCVIVPNASASAASLYGAYIIWHKKTEGGDAMLQKEFGTRLGQAGFSKKKKNGVIWWHGIGLRSDGESESASGMDRTMF